MSNFQKKSSNNEKHSFLSVLLSPLFKHLSLENKAYCVCGNYERLPYYTSNDVDIWTNDPEYIVNYIEKLCRDLDYIVYLKNTNATGSNLFICTKNMDAKEIIHIDVLRECRWYGFLPLVKSELIDQRKITYKDFYVADDTIDNVMHLMYPLVHFNKIPAKYREPIKRAASCHDFWEIVQECWGKSFCDKIKPLISDDAWKEVEEEFMYGKKG